MTTIMASIQPKWCELIANGKKTIEVRKSVPKGGVPFKCYIYQTKSKDKLIEVMQDGDECYGNTYHGKPVFVKTYGEGHFTGGSQKVIGEFVCDEVIDIESRGVGHNYDFCYESLNEFGNDDIEPYIRAIKNSCISKAELNAYGNNAHHLYGWHISDLKIYDEPKELGEFVRKCHENADCRKCDYWYPGSTFEPPNCGCDGYKPITRPPQSWCRVEERAGG